MSNGPVENVIIIGGGPAGLSAAIYLSRAGLQPLVFAGSPPGGQLTLTSEVENFPGHESILGSELIAKLRNQATKFGTRVVDENIIKVDFQPQISVFTSGNQYKSRSLLIATGARALWLGLESETKLRGRGVSACATCDGFFFKNKTVAVVGGGDTAMEEAMTLTNFASKVYLIHRRDSFRASKIMTERVIKTKKIEVIYNAVVTEILGDLRVNGIKIIINGSQEKQLLLDGIFIAIGHRPDTELFSRKIELDEKGYIITLSRLAEKLLTDPKVSLKQLDHNITKDYLYRSGTSVAGIFAAGDCVDYVYRQAATAVGAGVGAALDIEKYLVEYK